MRKIHFSPSFKNSVTRVELLGGIGNIVKVPHIDREVSFGNRHSKISGPKDFVKIIAPYKPASALQSYKRNDWNVVFDLSTTKADPTDVLSY